MIKGFKEFLLKNNVLALAVAVIVGGAVGKVVSSLAADIIMPLISKLIPGGEWRTAAREDVEALVHPPAVSQSAELADRSPGPVRPADREEVAVQLDGAGVLLVSPGDDHRHPVGPVGDGPAAVVEAVPPLDQVPARRFLRDVDPADLTTRPSDADRDVGGTRAAQPVVTALFANSVWSSQPRIVSIMGIASVAAASTKVCLVAALAPSSPTSFCTAPTMTIDHAPNATTETT